MGWVRVSPGVGQLMFQHATLVPSESRAFGFCGHIIDVPASCALYRANFSTANVKLTKRFRNVKTLETRWDLACSALKSIRVRSSKMPGLYRQIRDKL